MEVQSALDAIKLGFAEIREEISEKISQEVRKHIQAEDKKYDETILYRQKEDLYAIYEDQKQKLFEQTDSSIKRENQPHRRHSKADESSNASADSQIVQMKFDNLNMRGIAVKQIAIMMML